MEHKAELIAAGVKSSAVLAGTAIGGFTGKHIGAIAGSVIPVVGTFAGGAAGAYVGAAVGACVGDAAGEIVANTLLPIVKEATSPAYIQVDVLPDHRPPEFFEKIMHDYQY